MRWYVVDSHMVLCSRDKRGNFGTNANGRNVFLMGVKARSRRELLVATDSAGMKHSSTHPPLPVKVSLQIHYAIRVVC
jgi:hypothetical protein